MKIVGKFCRVCLPVSSKCSREFGLNLITTSNVKCVHENRRSNDSCSIAFGDRTESNI